MHVAVPLLARTVRGIEPLLRAEIHRSGAGTVRRSRHREVWFTAPDPGLALRELRTADDVLLLAAVVDGVGRAKAALPRLGRAASAVDARALLALRERAPEPTGLDVSASFLGRRAYTRFDLEDTVGAELSALLRLPYHSRRYGAAPPPGTASWRVTVEDDEAVIALRVAERPLHRRPYKTGSVPGTLHPPVAAAMARLARLDGARLVLDPCGGAGTTLVEARALAPHARYVGLDHSPRAALVATANSGPVTGERADPGRAIAWAVGDAGRIPLPGGVVDRVIVNPPWGRQVPPSGLLRGDDGLLWRELARVLAPGGLVVALLHDAPEQLRLASANGLRAERTVEVSLSGLHPVIAVLRRRTPCA